MVICLNFVTMIYWALIESNLRLLYNNVQDDKWRRASALVSARTTHLYLLMYLKLTARITDLELTGSLI